MKKLLSIALVIGATTLLFAKTSEVHLEHSMIVDRMVLVAELPKGSKMDKHGIVTKQSAVDVNTTINRLQKIVKKKGATFFNRINHAQNSRNTGAKNVLDSQLLIFGKPAVGLKLLALDPKVGLDLPLKVLAYQTNDGKVFVSYRDIGFLPSIYTLEGSKVPTNMSEMLDKLTNIVTKTPEDFKAFMKKNKK